MSKDEIFLKKTKKSSFSFNEDIAEVFDNMVQRSIINYEQVLELTAEAVIYFAQDNSNIYDLGCSTGNTLLAISKNLNKKGIKLFGYDLSEAMINKCQQKLNLFNYSNKIQVSKNDCLTAPIDKASVIIMNYTLQFIEPENRLLLLKRIYQNLKKNGIFIISEKIKEKNQTLSQFSLEKYDQIKEKNGYSQLEIANKRNALEKILKPNSYQENYNLLQASGFTEIMTLFKCLNFTTYLAIKQKINLNTI